MSELANDGFGLFNMAALCELQSFPLTVFGFTVCQSILMGLLMSESPF